MKQCVKNQEEEIFVIIGDKLFNLSFWGYLILCANFLLSLRGRYDT